MNIERPLAAGARLGGHFVQGHVDGTAQVTELAQQGDNWWLSVRLPDDLRGYVAEKGSIAIDGISLTVAAGRTASPASPSFPSPTRTRIVQSMKVGDRGEHRVRHSREIYGELAGGTQRKEITGFPTHTGAAGRARFLTNRCRSAYLLPPFRARSAEVKYKPKRNREHDASGQLDFEEPFVRRFSRRNERQHNPCQHHHKPKRACQPHASFPPGISTACGFFSRSFR